MYVRDKVLIHKFYIIMKLSTPNMFNHQYINYFQPHFEGDLQRTTTKIHDVELLIKESSKDRKVYTHKAVYIGFINDVRKICVHN